MDDQHVRPEVAWKGIQAPDGGVWIPGRQKAEQARDLDRQYAAVLVGQRHPADLEWCARRGGEEWLLGGKLDRLFAGDEARAGVTGDPRQATRHHRPRHRQWK